MERNRKRKTDQSDVKDNSKRFKTDRNNHRLIEKLKQIISVENDAELFLNLNIPNGPFMTIFNDQKDNASETICLVLKALGKIHASSSDGNTREILNNFLSNILPNNVCAVVQCHFFNVRLPTFISGLGILFGESDGQNNNAEYKDAIACFLKFLLKVQEIYPKACIDVVKKVVPNLLGQIHYINRNGEIFAAEYIETLNQILQNVDDELRNMKNSLEVQEVEKTPKDYYFRSIPICPDASDVLSTKRPYLPGNNIKQGYKEVDQYLDIQFRLLREDLIRPLREGIMEYVQLVKNNKTNDIIRIRNVNIYKNVQLVSSNITRNGDLIHSAKFDMENLGKIQWMCSKRFLTGSLVCLSPDNFETISFATLAGKRDPDKLRLGEFQLKFENDKENVNKAIGIFTMPKMTMIELKVFYEAYRHNLKVLQEFQPDSFPFKKYIIDVNKDIDPPSYLDPNTEYDLRSLRIGEDVNDQLMDKAEKIKILNKDSWPDKEFFKFDDSQYDAFIAALTKQIAIIQGPPGTGKTYLGHRIMQALLLNKANRKEVPILVVCYTNHALDQFMEGIVSFCDQIVRIGGGGGSKSETLEKYNINTIKMKMNETRSVPAYIFRNKRHHEISLKTTKNRIIDHYKILDQMRSRILCYTELSQSIREVNQSHDRSLLQPRSMQENIIAEWLGYKEIIGIANSDRTREHYRVANNRSQSHRIEPEVDGDESEVKYIENMRVIDEWEENTEVDQQKRTDTKKEDVKILYMRRTKNGQSRTGIPVELRLGLYSMMTFEEARRINSIWRIPHRDRWRLYRLWLYLLKLKKQDEVKEDLEMYTEEAAKYKTIIKEEDISICRDAEVIAMTTTGAAKYHHIIDKIQPQVIVVEEAAEVLEAHIITTLCANTEHLILIGDHLQLKPTPAVYSLAKKFNLEVSLFERLVLNGLEYFQLKKQHRMRPEISSLLVPHIYKELIDDESVKKFESVKGIRHNVFFLNHNKSDANISDINSHSNIFEVEFVVELCRYLIFQGYKESQITILTMYSGQLFQIRQKMRQFEFLKSVRMAVVDNYQGEENECIIISMVRSNEEGDIGFLKTHNRVNVALSRAKQGLYCIGNFDCLMKKSQLWKQIIDTAKKGNAYGEAMTMYCQNHEDFETFMSNASDFKEMPEGGCRKPCNARLNCGHACTLACHSTDLNHQLLKCLKTCHKIICEKEHRCPNKCLSCINGCKPCVVRMKKNRSCGHTLEVRCSVNPEDCFCTNQRTKKLLCGHEVKISCNDYEKTNVVCKEPCKAKLQCDHICSGTCSDCFQGRLHIPCQEKCSSILVCGHKCPQNCAEACRPCKRKCAIRCEHSSCQLKCREICQPCREPCAWKCAHLRCSQLCGELCDREMCTHGCKKKLPCNHTCIGICGEPCPKLCRLCDNKVVEEIFLGEEDQPGAKFLLLPDCKHAIEINGLLKWVKNQSDGTYGDDNENSEDVAIQAITCPKCKTPIGKSNALKKYTQSAQGNIRKIISKNYGDKEVNLQKTNELQNMISNYNGEYDENPNKRSDQREFNKQMRLMYGNIWKAIDTNGLSQVDLNAIDNTYTIWKKLQEFSTIYQLIEKIMNKEPKIIAKETLQKIKIRLGNLVKATNRFKNTNQEMKDIMQECKIIELIAKALHMAFLMEFDEQLCPKINDALSLALESDGEHLLDEARCKIIEISSRLSGMALPLEEKEMVLKAMDLKRGHWYKCPNNHIYCITECGGPMSTGICPECKSIIGGANHLLQKDNDIASEMDGAVVPAWPTALMHY